MRRTAGKPRHQAGGEPLEHRDRRMHVEVVPVHRVDVVAQPDPGIGDRNARRRHRRRDLGRRRRCVARLTPLVESERRAVFEPARGELVVVIARHDHHLPTGHRGADLCQHGQRDRERIALRPATALDRVAEQHQAIDAVERRDQSGARRRLAENVDGARRAEVQIGYDERAHAAPRLRLRGERLTDRLRKHEADVFSHDLELADVLDAAIAEVADSSRDELLGSARPGRDADDPLAVEPAIVDLAGVVDQMRLVGAVIARDLDQALRVRRVLRADHQHQIALGASCLTAAWRLVVAKQMSSVRGPTMRGKRSRRRRDDGRRLVDRKRRLRDVGDALRIVDHERVDVGLGLDEHGALGASPIVPSTSSWPA